MFGIKISFESKPNETLNDIKSAVQVSASAFAEAYHKSKVRSLQRSLNALQDIEQERNERSFPVHHDYHNQVKSPENDLPFDK